MKRTTIFADEETLAALRAIARERGMSLAEAVRQALAVFVPKHRPHRPGFQLLPRSPTDPSRPAAFEAEQVHREPDVLVFGPAGGGPHEIQSTGNYRPNRSL